MSDMMGDRRFIAALDSVSSFSNFDFLYFDLQHRMNWGFRVFDNRSFFTAPDFQQDRIVRVRQTYRETGAIGILSYPFDRYHRLDVGGGYMSREIAYPFPRPGRKPPIHRAQGQLPDRQHDVHRRQHAIQVFRTDFRAPL